MYLKVTLLLPESTFINLELGNVKRDYPHEKRQPYKINIYRYKYKYLDLEDQSACHFSIRSNLLLCTTL